MTMPGDIAYVPRFHSEPLDSLANVLPSIPLALAVTPRETFSSFVALPIGEILTGSESSSYFGQNLTDYV
jgi:hypothetical protein